MLLSLALLFSLTTALTAQATSPTLTLPTGTTVEMTLTRPLLTSSTTTGTAFYAQTDLPAVLPGGTAIPSGTYVEGTIVAITPATNATSMAVLHLQFNTLIFANNYVVDLTSPTLPRTMSMVLVKETPANDLYLDNGDKVTLTTASPLTLDTSQIAEALPLSVAPNPNQFHSGTLCVAYPATPDTIIPGTPGTPGTYIPGSPGSPGVHIPGTPGTPSQTIPGSPGNVCPAPPAVISSTPELTISSPTLPSKTKKKKKK